MTALRHAEEISKTARPLLTAVSAKILDVQQGSSASQARLPDEPNIVCAEWRRALGTLDANQPPSKVPPLWWRGVIRDAEVFMSVWGKQRLLCKIRKTRNVLERLPKPLHHSVRKTLQDQ